MCYWLITETGNLVSNKLFQHIMRDDYLKPDMGSRVDDFNKKLTERLDDGNFQVNSDVDGKFDFILTDEDLSKNLGIHCARGGTTMDEEYDDIIVKE